MLPQREELSCRWGHANCIKLVNLIALYATLFGVGLVQSTLGFATTDIAANLDLATAKSLTDLCQYINSDLVFRYLKFRAFIKIATVIPSEVSLDLRKDCF